MGICHVTCLWRKKGTRLHTYIKKASCALKGIDVWEKEKDPCTLHGEKEIGLHMEMEKKNNSDWKEIESKVDGNDETLSVYFLYYVVYYFNHV